jgi:hypothetical protein
MTQNYYNRSCFLQQVFQYDALFYLFLSWYCQLLLFTLTENLIPYLYLYQ